MPRAMVDAIHDNLGAALPTINSLSAGDAVGVYGTGASDVLWTTADMNHIKSDLHIVVIDQAFGPHAPLRSANVIDSETGAWSAGDIDARMAEATSEWPTLYSGMNNLEQVARSEKWRGPVWLASPTPNGVIPVEPPKVPAGFTVVAQQYLFGTSYDRSVIFHPTWPFKTPTIITPPTGKARLMLIVHIQGQPEVYVWNGTNMSHITSVDNEAQFKAAGLQSIQVTPDQFAVLAGAPTGTTPAS